MNIYVIIISFITKKARAKMNNKRVENKFIFKSYDKYKIYNALTNRGYKEIYDQRTVKSIYFDTVNLQLYRDSLEGSVPRKKIRIRSYENISNSLTKEEKKVTEEGRFKYSEKISNFPTYIIDDLHNLLFPKLDVRYKRLYFSNNIIRLTIDFDITYRSLEGGRAVNSPNLILESKLLDKENYSKKVDDFKIFGSNAVSFSKYTDGINHIKFFKVN